MTDDKKRAIEQLRKLLALATSDNEHEAALAAQRAAEIMMRYNIDHIEPELTTNETVEERVIGKTRANTPIHERIIITAVCDVFDCHYLCGITNRRRQRNCIYGAPSDLECVQYLAVYLLRAIRDVSLRERRRRSRMDIKQFRRGMALQIAFRLSVMKKAQQDQHNQIQALVLHKDAAIDRFFEKQGFNIKEAKSHRAKCEERDFVRGAIFGDQVPINTALAQQTTDRAAIAAGGE